MSNVEERKCLICGKSLYGTNRRKYCSDKCSDKASKQNEKSWKKKEREAERNEKKAQEQRRRAKPEKKKSLVNVAIAARKAGLSYGQYVGKMGL